MRIIAVRLRINAAEKSKLQSAKKWRAIGKNEGITDRPPEDRHQAGNTETLRQDRQDVFRADKTAVKQRQPWQRHKQHQRGACHHPCIVAGAGARDVRGHCRAGIDAAR